MANFDNTTLAPVAHTTRRSLLIAAPAVAPDNAFQRTVAAYHASVQRQKLAGEAHTMYETAEDGLGEPRRMIRVRGDNKDERHSVN